MTAEDTAKAGDHTEVGTAAAVATTVCLGTAFASQFECTFAHKISQCNAALQYGIRAHGLQELI